MIGCASKPSLSLGIFRSLDKVSLLPSLLHLASVFHKQERVQTPTLLGMAAASVSVSCRVILRTDNQTTPLLRAAVDGFDDVDQFLLIL